LRLQRQLRPEQTQERARLIKDAIDFITPQLLQKLRTRPVLLRETAAELASEDAPIAGAAIETLGLEVGTDEQARALGEAIVQFEKSQAYDPEANAALVANAGEFEKSDFDPSMIRTWAKEVATGRDTRALGATLKGTTDTDVLVRFGEYFQSSARSGLEASVMARRVRARRILRSSPRTVSATKCSRC
jgi:hypothetical protein